MGGGEVAFLKKHRADIILIAALLAAAAIAWAFLRLGRQDGAAAIVTVNGEMRAELPLGKDTSVIIEGEGRNTVTVRGGAVCVESADCPDGLCVRQGWAKYEGETIVCLPNGLVVTVRGGEAGMDAVSQ